MPQLYSTPYTVNPGQVPSTQTDFPMLVSFTDSRFKTVANGGRVNNSNGYDIRPYSDSGLTSALTYELERYNGTTGEVVMWVKRASLSNGTVTYLGCGDTSLTTDGSSNTTWSNSFAAVYHLKDGTTLNTNDSSASGANGTNNGATATTGKVDGGAGFVSASSQYISCTNTANTVAVTFSAWINAISFPSAGNAVFYKNSSNSDANGFYVKSNGKVAWVVVATSQIFIDGTGAITLSTGTWNLLHMTYDPTNGLKCYVNASSDVTAAANGNCNMTGTLPQIGRDTLNGRYWNGSIDEVRRSSVARSADWITTEYNNQSSPSTFATLGTEPVGLIFGAG